MLKNLFPHLKAPTVAFSRKSRRFVFGEQAIGSVRKSAVDTERWVTIGADKDEPGHGTHVKISGDGKIVAGPSGLADKGIRSLSDFGKKEGKKPISDDHRPWGASALANESSKQAISMADKKKKNELIRDHETAAISHEHAAKQHDAVGNTDQATSHRAAADAHRQTADKLRSKKEPQSNDDNEKPSNIRTDHSTHGINDKPESSPTVNKVEGKQEQAVGKPSQEQIDKIISEHPDAITLFRTGTQGNSHYEGFGPHADKLRKIVGASSFPHSHLEGHLRKLVASGHRVAIAEATPSQGNTSPVTPSPASPAKQPHEMTREDDKKPKEPVDNPPNTASIMPGSGSESGKGDEGGKVEGGKVETKKPNVSIDGHKLNDQQTAMYRDAKFTPIAGGSDKQNSWAEQIQYEKWHELLTRLTYDAPDDKSTEYINKVVATLNKETSPRFWIDNKNLSGVDILKKIGW